MIAEESTKRHRWVSMVAVGVVVMAVVAAAVRTLAPAAGVAPVVMSSPPAEPMSAPLSTPSTVPPLSEADLMPPSDQAVGAYAAWFVAEFFTIDGAVSSVSDLLPAGVTLPAPEQGTRSFVEEVFPVKVSEVGTGRFAVTVVVRSLEAAAGEEYVRAEPRAVTVVIEVGEDGPAVVDLPRPAAVPLETAAELVVEEQEIPPEVLAAAFAEAELLGTPATEPLTAGRVGTVWRIVLLVEDTAGLAWPVSIWLDDAGTAIPAGGF